MAASLPTSLTEGAVEILKTAEPAGKIRLTHDLAAAWRAGALPVGSGALPPARPARPATPELRLPRDMPKRRSGGSLQSRVALLHALAHIELNALDLVWDLVARFADPVVPELARPRQFWDDWVKVSDEEATHHGLLADRLAALDAAYGDLPAHDGLWQAAEVTAHDLLARLAIVPLVLEARGLDVTPQMIGGLDKFGDTASAAALRVIYRDEIGHVAIGRRWFDAICAERGLAPEPTWQDLVRRHFKGALKRPFNTDARAAAGLPADFYEPLAAPGGDAS
ncbi:rhamnosyltransferase [Aliidongia dinghuensis]|uniref:Rhamnosyltransferase n=1 Tax=Aliidongia dinghuensis TaxID=1867774 RepID=A0A8J2YWD9_9PROT|nr:ferritin-like domain-containing protein [Aliidongia dinghuensis]GGF31952.1 rhamnosyltransferase [Aliidongia dinghuensis]